jgi:hypothetical protein
VEKHALKIWIIRHGFSVTLRLCLQGQTITMSIKVGSFWSLERKEPSIVCVCVCVCVCVVSVPRFNKTSIIWTMRHGFSRNLVLGVVISYMPIPVAACCKCGFESCRGHGCLSLVIVVCCQVQVPALGWSHVQGSPTECGVSECDREASIMKRPYNNRGCCAMGEGAGEEKIIHI